MILPNRGLSNEKIKGISSKFKEALLTGAIFATVALSGLSLTGCGMSVGSNKAETESESESSIESGSYNENSKVSFSQITNKNSNYTYVVDEMTDLVYLQYNGYNSAGLTPALMLDEETGATRVMTKADLEKMLELNAEAERDF